MAEPDTASSSAADPSAPTLAEESLSLADHEAKYSGVEQQTSAEPETRPTETPAPEPEGVDEGTPETDAAGPRDEKGRFLPKTRHRAASAIAGPEDVPRIRELTARLRAAEAERDALKARTGETMASAPRAVPPPPVAIAEPSPKPTPDKFSDYSEYVEALTDWKTDQKLAAAEQKRQQAEQQRAAEAEATRIETSWETRKVAARAKYADFDDVALLAPTTIPAGSLIDAWILEDETGADVLYHLQQHPDEVQTMLNQSVLQQAKSLALLAQRFNGSTRTAAAPTGSAPAQPVVPTPRPPNPVRTGPLRTGDEPPDEEVASLADHEKWYAPRRARGG